MVVPYKHKLSTMTTTMYADVRVEKETDSPMPDVTEKGQQGDPERPDSTERQSA